MASTSKPSSATTSVNNNQFISTPNQVEITMQQLKKARRKVSRAKVAAGVKKA